MLYTAGLFTKGAVTVVPRQREGRVWARSKVVKMGWSEFILLELKENQRQEIKSRCNPLLSPFALPLLLFKGWPQLVGRLKEEASRIAEIFPITSPLEQHLE